MHRWGWTGYAAGNFVAMKIPLGLRSGGVANTEGNLATPTAMSVRCDYRRCRPHRTADRCGYQSLDSVVTQAVRLSAAPNYLEAGKTLQRGEGRS